MFLNSARPFVATCARGLRLCLCFATSHHISCPGGNATLIGHFILFTIRNIEKCLRALKSSLRSGCKCHVNAHLHSSHIPVRKRSMNARRPAHNSCSGTLGGVWGLVPPSHLGPYLHVLCTNSKSDLKKGIALRGVWVRCPPEVPYMPNYINLYICLLLDFFYLSLKHLGAIY